MSEVTLFGTRHTMDSELIAEYFERENIKLGLILETDKKKIDDLRSEVYRYGASEERAEVLNEITSKYKHPILICTELSVVNSVSLDAIDIQINSCLNAVV